MLVESRDPFRQARLFFFYPATIAGASVASWVSLTRLIAGSRCHVDTLGLGFLGSGK